MKKIILKPGAVTPDMLRAVFENHVPLSLPAQAYRAIDKSAALVDAVVARGKPVYGVNTGFGALARVRIDADDLGGVQRNLLLSHAAGVGDDLPDDVVRLILLLKINALAQGFSGVRRAVVDFLLALYNNKIYPCVPEKGSVGASGDLAPLAHLALPLIGEGFVRVDGAVFETRKILQKYKLEPLQLAPKEGLALINGTQVSAALALRGLFAAENVFAAAAVAGALSVDAAKGSTAPFDAGIQKLRRQKGQIDMAAAYRALLKGSAIRASHDNDNDPRVQDPYCLRCMPQVMGACLDHIRFAAGIFCAEANAVTDNPLVFQDGKKIISGGNFHAEPVAMAADTLALAIAETGGMSERRTAFLVDHKMSGLPPFLVADAGVNSGFMIAHVTAAALASENKALAHPCSVDSIPTSANQEDHVSMATHAARRLWGMAQNAAHIVAVELLAAAQGVDFHRPLKTSASLQKVMTLIRKDVPRYTQDRFMSPDIGKIAARVIGGDFRPFIKGGR